MKSYRHIWLIAVVGLTGLLIFLFLFGRPGDDNLAEPTTLGVTSLVTPVPTSAQLTPTFTRPPTSLPPTTTVLHSIPTPTTIAIPVTARAGLAPSPTATAVPATATAIPPPPTSTTSPLPTATVVIQATITPALPTTTLTSTSQLILLKPLPTAPCYGDQDIHFEWQWSGPFDPTRQGFEVRIWREGEPPLGAHDAVLDNKNGQVKALNQNIYGLDMRIDGAAGVQGRSSDYLWTVLLVEIAPGYKDLGLQAPPGRLCYAAPGGKHSSGGDNGSSGGNGGGPINP